MLVVLWLGVNICILTDILTASELRAVKGGGWRRWRRWRVEAVEEEELEWEEVEGGDVEGEEVQY